MDAYKSRLREMENEITKLDTNHKKSLTDIADLTKLNEELLEKLRV